MADQPSSRKLQVNSLGRDAPDAGLPWWDRSPIVKGLAGAGARTAALPVGAARGALHSAEGLLGSVVFAGRLANPILDELFSPPGQTARENLDNAVGGSIDYFRNSTAKEVVGDVGKQLRHFRAGIDPTATPQAPTLLGEIARSGRIGMNQGELGFDVASTLYGGEAVEGLAALSGLSKATRPAEYLAQGYSPELARYFGSPLPDNSMGHHFLTRATVKDAPPLIRPLLKAVSESRFSVLKPKGMSRGDFYKLHYRVDPKYRGGEAGKPFGNVKWNGEDLGWEKYGLLGRIIHGSPAPLKALVASPVAITAGAVVNWPQPDEAVQ